MIENMKRGQGINRTGRHNLMARHISSSAVARSPIAHDKLHGGFGRVKGHDFNKHMPPNRPYLTKIHLEIDDDMRHQCLVLQCCVSAELRRVQLSKN